MEEALKKSLRILDYVKKNATQGDVDSVLATIDNYEDKYESAIHVGKVKGMILDAAVLQCNPKFVLELGTYFGYSALRIAKLLQPNAVFYSVESVPQCEKIAKEIIEFAGMKDRIKVLPGKSTDILTCFKNDKSLGISTFDFVFIDHAKDFYKQDTVMLEHLQLLKKGSVLLADNVLYPGAPEFLAYVRNNAKYACSNFPVQLKSSNIEDALEKCICLM